jgi:hypothetical protein
MAALATQQAHRAWLLPDPVGGYRVGWFDQPGLVFAEGRPGGEAPCAAASPSAGKLVAYRAERCVESVLIKSRAGRTLARLYDKGAQGARAPRGRWLRFEAQWRLPRDARIDPAKVDPALLRERFKRRFEPLWEAAGGFRIGGLEAATERISEAVASGQLQPSRARSVSRSRCSSPLSAASMSPPSSTSAWRRRSGSTADVDRRDRPLRFQATHRWRGGHRPRPPRGLGPPPPEGHPARLVEHRRSALS